MRIFMVLKREMKQEIKNPDKPFFFFLSSSSKVAAFSQLRPVKSYSCSAYAQQVTGIHKFNSFKCSQKSLSSHTSLIN